MPKIVASNQQWKPVDIPGDFVNEENFAFLSAFEECETVGNDNVIKKKKLRKKRGRAANKAKLRTKNPESSREKLEPEEQEQLEHVKKLGSAINDFDERLPITDSEESGSLKMDSWSSLGLSTVLMKAISDMRFYEPTEIQKMVIPRAITERCDVIGAAETGSGKTLAFAIPVVELLLADRKIRGGDNENKAVIKALILTPTRELAMQIRSHITALLKYTHFKAVALVGGLSQQKQERLLKYAPEIVIATPGRLLAFITSTDEKNCVVDLSRLSSLVIDETDRMVEKERFEELQQILQAVKKQANPKLQTFLFSATLTFAHPRRLEDSTIAKQKQASADKIANLVSAVGLRKNYKVFDLTEDKGTAGGLIEAKMNCQDLLEKDLMVVYLLERYIGRTLIFTNSVDASRRLHGILCKLGRKPTPVILHAKMLQKKRLNNLEKFTAEENSVLIATDVAARGLDIIGVEHVIHYQVPRTAELYIHRCGRTARVMRSGVSVLLVDLQDVQTYSRIYRDLKRENELSLFPIDSPDLHCVLKQRVELASAIEAIEHRLRKMQARDSWFDKAATIADLMLDEREKTKEEGKELYNDLHRQRKLLVAQLKHLMAAALPKRAHIIKSRYASAEVVKSYENSLTHNAVNSLENNDQKMDRKRRRTVSARHLHIVKKKKRK